MLTAVGKLNLDPADVWYVDDRAAGLQSVWYNPLHRADPELVSDAEIHHWNELPERVRAHLCKELP